MKLSGAGLERLDVGGRPIGMFDDSTFDDAEITLAPGDDLVLFTDGILEAPAPGTGEEFGEQRLAAAVRDRRGLSVDDALEGVLDEVRAWTGDQPPHDDVTLVLVRSR
jgi:sigma-B regulation protein RsbU (phosphoserine phosphatase)